MASANDYVIEDEDTKSSVLLPPVPTLDQSDESSDDSISHYNQYWKTIIDSIIQSLNKRDQLSSLLSVKLVVARLLTRTDPRHLTLDKTNPKVQERLLHIDGMLEFLYKLGFESNNNDTLLTVNYINRHIVSLCSVCLNNKVESLKSEIKYDAEQNLSIATNNVHIGRFKEVERNSAYLVFGYLRSFENSLSMRNIEYDIYQICCIFYYIPNDKWDANNMSNLFRLYGNVLAYPFELTFDSPFSVYGSVLLSNTVWYGRHHWKFKVHNFYAFDSSLCIGIWNENVCFDKTQCIGWQAHSSYALNVATGEINIYTKDDKWIPTNKQIRVSGKDHYIDMYVNFNEHNMSFIINNEYYTKTKTAKKLFRIEDFKYRVAVSCNDCVEIELLLYEFNALQSR